MPAQSLRPRRGGPGPLKRGDVFGIGGPELVVIVLLLLIFVGPEKLPEVMRTVGGGMRDLRRAANLAQAEVKRGLDELSREVEEVSRDVQDAARGVAQDVHGIGRDLQAQVERAADAEPPGEDSETIEVVRRKSAPPPLAGAETPRLESAPPWALPVDEVPNAAPAVAVQRPRFNPPAVPAGTVARDLPAAAAEPEAGADPAAAAPQVAAAPSEAPAASADAADSPETAPA